MYFFGLHKKKYFDQKSHSIASELYRLWHELSVGPYLVAMNQFCLISMCLLIPFDFLLFQNWEFYSFLRLPVIALNLLIMILNRKKISFLNSVKAKEKLLFVVPAIVSVLYLFFLHFSETKDKQIVFLGNLMVTIFCTFLFYRFWKAQTYFNLLGIPGAFLFAFLNPEKYQLFLLLGIAQIFSYFTAFVLRRDFTEALIERFQNLSSLIPIREAKLISVTNDRQVMDKVFKSRMRYSVCLCADWRNFQKMTQNKSPDEVSRYFSVFYDNVFNCLNDSVPGGTFYANWVADELFVVFYDELDREEVVDKMALDFTKVLISKVYNDVFKELGFSISFDVGLSSGHGLLGLQGPKALRKTTITGEHAGVAKRLQSLAKNLRKTGVGTPPFVCVSESLALSAQKIYSTQNIFLVNKVEVVDVKDLENTVSYTLQLFDRRSFSSLVKKVS